MKKAIFLSLMIILCSVVPVNACTIKRTADNEYYLYLREYNEIRVFEDKGLDAYPYEGNAPLYDMLEDGGFNSDISIDNTSDDTSFTSSDSGILSTNSLAHCVEPGDVKVTVKQGDKTKVNKVHIYDLKLKPVYRTSKKAVLKTKGNLKGCTALLKIGKKTYKKKITRKNQVLKFRIKKPSVGKKITVTIKKGDKDIFSAAEYVLYQKRIVKGMSRKRAEHTYEYEYNRFNPVKKGKQEIWKFGKVKVVLKNNKVVKVVR